MFKKPLLNEGTFLSSKSNDSPYVTNNLQYIDLNQPSTSSNIVHPVKDDNCTISVTDKSELINNAQPSCSNYNVITPVEIKTEPNISRIQFSQGSYRSEEDSVIVIYSSDEENNTNENYCEVRNIKLEPNEQQIHLNSISAENASSSKVENNLNLSEWANHNYEILSDDEDIICRSSKINSIKDDLMSSNDSDSDSNCKIPQIIEPLPLKSNTKKGQSKMLYENENIIKTRAKSAKICRNKKKVKEITVDQNKQIIEARRIKLQQLTNTYFTPSTEPKTSINNKLTTDDIIDKPSTTDILKKKSRISRLQQNDGKYCMPSTSKAHLIKESKIDEPLVVQKKVTFNPLPVLSKIDNQQIKNVSTSITSQVNFSFFDTLSRICKWNAVWLYVS